MEKEPTFYKMRVTGPRCAEFITQPLDAIRELNPSINAMIQSSEGMNRVLCEAAKQPLNKRRKTASSVVAIHDAHLQRLKAFKSNTEHMYDPLLQALSQQQAPLAQMRDGTPHQPPPEDIDESSLASRGHMQRIMAAIPKQFRMKAATLGDYLKAHPDLIRVTPEGRPIVSGTEMRHANIVDIMRSLYIHSKRQALPSGTKEVIEALHSAGIPSYLLSNPTVRTAYQAMGEEVEEARAITSDEGREQGHREEEEEEEEGEQEMSTMYETPIHSAVPAQAAMVKAEEPTMGKRSPSLLPKPAPAVAATGTLSKRHGPSIASTSGSTMTKHEVGRPTSGSSIPKPAVRHETSKPTSGQIGHGRKINTNFTYDDRRLPGKPSNMRPLW